MRVFKEFNGSHGDVCPICGTSKKVETVLVPMPWTEDDGIVEAKQMHKKCYELFIEMNEVTSTSNMKGKNESMGNGR